MLLLLEGTQGMRESGWMTLATVSEVIYVRHTLVSPNRPHQPARGAALSPNRPHQPARAGALSPNRPHQPVRAGAFTYFLRMTSFSILL